MKLIPFTFVLSSVCLLAHSGPATQDVLHYRLQIRVEPATHKLEADAWIRHAPASRFYLCKGCSVRQVEADGKAVKYALDRSAPGLPFSPESTAVSVDAPDALELHIQYGGELSEVINQVNMISPELVELALYSVWYPMFPGFPEFTFELQANLPNGFVTTTNGMQTAQREQEGRRITSWHSFKPGIDIVLLASPLLHRLQGGTDETKVEVDYYQLPPSLMQAKIEGLAAGMNKLATYYGAPRLRGTLRLVYSPRDGWGYSRIPLIVVSERRAKGVLSEANGEAMDFRDNAHELAHFWWTVADPGTPNDWINEGLAEFSAFRLAEWRFGQAFKDARLAEYRQNATKNRTADSIAETAGDSPDREINRYDKAALMFLEAQQRFGLEPLDRLLKEIHTRFAGTMNASTATFLAEAGKRMGPEAEAYFRAELYRKPRVSNAENAEGKR